MTIRIDVLRTATQKLMDTAQSTATFSGQFRTAIYTFGTSCTLPTLDRGIPADVEPFGSEDRGGQYRPDDGPISGLQQRPMHDLQ